MTPVLLVTAWILAAEALLQAVRVVPATVGARHLLLGGASVDRGGYLGYLGDPEATIRQVE